MKKKLLDAAKENKLIIGAKETLRTLKLSQLEEIFISQNCPEDIKARIRNLATVSKTKVNELKESSEEFGAICKKPFAIAVAGIKKVKE